MIDLQKLALAQKITDLAYRVICENSGECEIENLPNKMQCIIDSRSERGEPTMIDLHKLARETWAMANSRRDKTGRAQDAVDTIHSALERVQGETRKEGDATWKSETEKEGQNSSPKTSSSAAPNVQPVGVRGEPWTVESIHAMIGPISEHTNWTEALWKIADAHNATLVSTAERKLLDEVCDALGCPHDAEALLKAVRAVGVRGEETRKEGDDLRAAKNELRQSKTASGSAAPNVQPVGGAAVLVAEFDRIVSGECITDDIHRHQEMVSRIRKALSVGVRGEIWTVRKSDLRGGRSGLFIGSSKVPLIQAASHKLQPVADAHNATLTRDEC